jgi:hypothetical protein
MFRAMLGRLGSLLWRAVFRSRRFVVLGEQMAQARRAEEARPSSLKNAPSPLPANLQYDSWRGDLDLSNPVELPLDGELRALCQRFEVSDLATRSELRDTASMDDFYTLLAYSQRAAVFAMRRRTREYVHDGLTAIAMIELKRIDFRDALVALALLYHAARTVGEQANELFQKAASLAEPETSELIVGFLKRPEGDWDIRQWGYIVVHPSGGPGFVRSDFESYEPTYPLDKIALALARLVEQDKYGRSSVTLASSLPAVWLISVDDSALNRALAVVRGAVTINAELRPQESPDSDYNGLMIFLAELDDEAAAESLLKLSEGKQTRHNDFVLAAAKEGRLFCLTVARSFAAATRSFETQASVQRFSTRIASVLRAHQPS